MTVRLAAFRLAAFRRRRITLLEAEVRSLRLELGWLHAQVNTNSMVLGTTKIVSAGQRQALTAAIGAPLPAVTAAPAARTRLTCLPGGAA